MPSPGPLLPNAPPLHLPRRSSSESEAAAFARWTEAMADGAFEAAWRVNDGRGKHWPSAHRLTPALPRVGGTHRVSLELRALHGFGDAVQMLAYLPRLRALGYQLSFGMAPALRALLPYVRGAGECVSTVDESEAAHARVCVECMELPYLLRTRLQELPIAQHYLALPPELEAAAAHAMGERRRPRVGIVWAGGDWDRERWLPLHLLGPLLADGRFEWWNLQGGAAGCPGLPLKRLPEVCGAGPHELDGLVGLAATMTQLDLVLTVDTLAAHLAGAMGVPAWLLLKHHADWRWMRGRTDSPWYPSLRLFRQGAPGDWSKVIAEVRAELAAKANRHPEGWRSAPARLG